MFQHYPDWEYTFASAQLIAFMLAMGAKLHVSQFTHVLRRPRSFIVTLVGHLFVIPFVAVLINQVADLGPGVAVGLVLVVAMPGGTLAKIFTYFGHGNVALAITVSVVSTLLCIVTVPLMLRLLTAGLDEDINLPIPQIVREVVLFLLAPLALSMIVSPRSLWVRDFLSTWGVRVGLVIIVVMVAGSLGSGRIRPGAYGWAVPLAIILFCVAGQQLVQLPFYIFGWPPVDRMAAGMEITMRNMNLALLLYASLFADNPRIGPEILFVILYYAATAMIVGLPLALRHRRIHKRLHASPPGDS